MKNINFSLLSRLWLHEPDAETIARAVSELGLPAADPVDLASAYADLFLLNVFPYGTAFTSDTAELNGSSAQRMMALFDEYGYHPPELNEVGAPDHLGLSLGFLAHLAERRLETGDFLSGLLDWALACCLAVEREPGAHPFYRTLAAHAREVLMADASGDMQYVAHYQPLTIDDAASPDEEIGLRDIVRFFLAPARCGMFLSRSRLGRMANALGLSLPFGSRFEVAETLFVSAGESGCVDRLLQALTEELHAWLGAYQDWAHSYPAWRPVTATWIDRIKLAQGMLANMGRILAGPLEVEYENGLRYG